jgi:nucleotide-binding universal stress UspA family protein
MTSPTPYPPALHHRLVVGFDGSDSSLKAIEWAASEAGTRGASVRVITSYSMEPLTDFAAGATDSGVDMTEIEAECADRLRTATTAVFDDHPGVDHEIETVRVSPARALLAEAEHADLVVVGSTGAGSFTRFLLGSTTGALLASCPCPVVVVPAEAREPTGRIVVGTDGSEHAEHAVRWAADEADRRGAELIIVHGWKHHYHLTIEGVDRADDLAPVDAELILDRAVEASRAVSGASTEGRLVEGSVADTLLDLSTTADLLVVGSRGRGGFRAMLFGSIASSVATHSNCPTVIVR